MIAEPPPLTKLSSADCSEALKAVVAVMPPATSADDENVDRAEIRGGEGPGRRDRRGGELGGEVGIEFR